MKRLFWFTPVAVLIGCGGGGGSSGGGGGGGGGSSIQTVPFTSWNDLRPNTEIVAPAISTEATYTENLAETTTSVGNFTTYTGIEFRETFGADGSVTKASLTTGDGDRLVFDTAQGAAFIPIANGFATAAANADLSEIAIAVEPIPLGWNYQTFGVWQRSPTQGSPGRVGAISTGNFTAANNIPNTGSASFIGLSSGSYLEPGGATGGLTTANMAVVVDFSNRVAGFATANTVLSRDGGQTFTTFPALDLTGSLQVASGQNLMSGTVSTTPGSSVSLSGDIYGKFYGPSAQEVGGTFGLKGTGVQSYVGGFGGKR
jgi:hypothetical protein